MKRIGDDHSADMTSNTFAIAIVLPVASSTTLSSGFSLAAKRSNSSRSSPTRPPARRTLHLNGQSQPPIAIHLVLSLASAFPMGSITNGSRWDSTTTTDSRSQHNRAGRRGGQLLIRTRGSTYMNGLPTRSAPRCPCLGWSDATAIRTVRRGGHRFLSCRLPTPWRASMRRCARSSRREATSPAMSRRTSYCGWPRATSPGSGAVRRMTGRLP